MVVSDEVLQKICENMLKEIDDVRRVHILHCLQHKRDVLTRWVDLNVRKWSTNVSLEVGRIVIFDHHGLLAHNVVQHLEKILKVELYKLPPEPTASIVAANQ